MMLLILFAFVGGLVTVLSPCILPVLPIILSVTVDGNRRRPVGIIIGFVLGFSIFTLFLSAIVKLTGLSADLLRNLSIFVLTVFGLTLLFPKLLTFFEKITSWISGASKVNPGKNKGFSGGIVIGLSLGMLWTPCVGPILAAIIALAATNTVGYGTFFITLAYSIGTAIPMFAIMRGGRGLIDKVPWLTKKTSVIQSAFGIVMILVSVGMFFNLDRRFQTYVINKFPQYGAGLTKIEDNPAVKKELSRLSNINSSFSAQAPELIQGGQWFNSEPLKLSQLRGKVVLLDFWTYTCINCIRTLPYVKDWYEKYKDKGLVVIGVHTPEFEFEKNPVNVSQAIRDFGIKYPVMQDNEYATWNAYSNQYWPAKYFIDQNGKIRSTHFGEGGYDESEKMIQELLKESGGLKSDMPIKNTDYSIESQTPETYLGYARISNFASLENISKDKKAGYTLPEKLFDNEFGYKGFWTVRGEKAEPEKSASLSFNYGAKNVFLVAGSKNKKTGQVNIYLDGKKIGSVTVDVYKLYDIVKLPRPERHVLKLEFLDSNLELFAFTFG